MVIVFITFSQKLCTRRKHKLDNIVIGDAGYIQALCS